MFNPAGGYYKFPNGLIMQWGNTKIARRVGESSGKIYFPIRFPHMLLSIATGVYRNGLAGSGEHFQIMSYDNDGFITALDSQQSKWYIALGY